MDGLLNHLRCSLSWRALLLCCGGLSTAAQGLELSGFVKGDSGEPIGHIMVYASAQTEVPGESFVYTLTDTNGAFDLPVSEGTWYVQADASALNALGYRGAHERYVYVLDDDPRLDFVCPKALLTTRLAGRAVDDTGAGLANVTVRAFNQDALFEASIEADVSGHFDLPVFGGVWTLRLDGAGIGSTQGLVAPESRVRVVDALDRTNLTLIARTRTAQLNGWVEDSFGNKLTDYSVSMTLTSNGTNYRAWFFNFFTNDFSVGLFEGLWQIDVFASNPSPGTVLKIPTQLVNVAATNPPLRLAALPLKTHLLGRVVDESGVPQTNVTVSAFSSARLAGAQTETAADGSFDLEVFGGSWNLQAGHAMSGWLSTSLWDLEVKDGIDHTNLTLVVRRASARIVGALRDPASGRSIASARIWASASVEGQRYSVSGGTDQSGSFRLPVFDGTWEVTVDAAALPEAGYQRVDSQTVSVVSTTAVHFAIRPFTYTTRVRGRAVDSAGNAFGFVPVSPYDYFPVFPMPSTAQDGTFDFHLSAGSWLLAMENIEAEGQLWLGPKLNLELAPGLDETNVTLVARLPTSQIVGTITETNGSPLPDMFLSAWASIDGTNYAVSAGADLAGRFQLGVLDGTWDVFLYDYRLNDLGFQSLPLQRVTVSGTNEPINFVALPIVGDGRVPSLSPPTRQSDGTIQLTVTSQTSRDYRVEASSNLAVWTPVSTNYTFGGTFTFTDAEATNAPTRFYRAALIE